MYFLVKSLTFTKIYTLKCTIRKRFHYKVSLFALLYFSLNIIQKIYINELRLGVNPGLTNNRKII